MHQTSQLVQIKLKLRHYARHGDILSYYQTANGSSLKHLSVVWCMLCRC